MRRKVITTAVLVASAGFVSSVVAEDDTAKPKLYGQVEVALERYDYEDDNTPDDDYDEFRVESYKSRLGVKGKLPVSDGYNGIYKLEWEVDVDDGGSTVFAGREMFGGFETPYGTLIMGKHDTPLKDSQGKVDLFDETTGDIGQSLNDASTISGEERVGNVLGYISPKISESLELRAFAIQGEEGGDSACDAANEDCDDGFGDGLSFSAVFEQDQLYAAVAYDNGVEGDGGGLLSLTDESVDYDRVRATLGFDFGAVILGVIAQVAEINQDSESELERSNSVSNIKSDETSYVFSIGVPLGDVLLKAQYGMSEYEEELGTTEQDHDRTALAFGADFNVSEQSKVYLQYVQQESEVDSGATTNEIDESVIALGFKHKF